MPGQFPVWVFVRHISRVPWRRHFGLYCLVLVQLQLFGSCLSCSPSGKFPFKTEKITVVRRQQKPKTRLTMSEAGGMQLECVGENLLGLMFNIHLKGNNDLGYSQKIYFTLPCECYPRLHGAVWLLTLDKEDASTSLLLQSILLSISYMPLKWWKNL